MSFVQNGNAVPSCCYCGSQMSHAGFICPNIKSIEYYQDGSIKKVELWPETRTMECQ